MSSGDGELEFVTPEDVRAEYNLIEQVTQHIGVEDNLEAAILTNLARQAEFERRQTEFLSILTGQPIDVQAPLRVTVTDPLQVSPPDVNPSITVEVDEITPTVDLPEDVSVQIEGIDINQSELAAAFEEAVTATNRIQLYNVSSQGSGDNILSQPLQATTEHSTFRVSVTLDTATTFILRTNPSDSDAFTSNFNQGGNLSQDSKREFSFDADPEAEYNFRMGSAGTVKNLRVQEVLTE